MQPIRKRKRLLPPKAPKCTKCNKPMKNHKAIGTSSCPINRRRTRGLNPPRRIFQAWARNQESQVTNSSSSIGLSGTANNDADIVGPNVSMQPVDYPFDGAFMSDWGGGIVKNILEPIEQHDHTTATSNAGYFNNTVTELQAFYDDFHSLFPGWYIPPEPVGICGPRDTSLNDNGFVLDPFEDSAFYGRPVESPYKVRGPDFPPDHISPGTSNSQVSSAMSVLSPPEDCWVAVPPSSNPNPQRWMGNLPSPVSPVFSGSIQNSVECMLSLPAHHVDPVFPRSPIRPTPVHFSDSGAVASGSQVPARRTIDKAGRPQREGYSPIIQYQRNNRYYVSPSSSLADLEPGRSFYIPCDGGTKSGWAWLCLIIYSTIIDTFDSQDSCLPTEADFAAYGNDHSNLSTSNDFFYSYRKPENDRQF